jgi:hypothetical protein
MLLRTFTKTYDLQLLPAAHTGILLGNLVWNPFLGKPKLSHPGMPNHIGNALYDVGIITKTAWQDMLKTLDVPMCKNAKLAKIKIDAVQEVAGSVLDKLGLGFEQAYVVESVITDVCAKVMKNNMRVELDEFLEQVHPKLFRSLFRNPRKVYMITELYYGSLKLKVEKKHELTFERMVAATKWPVRADLNNKKNHEYVFAHNEVPFAYKMERILGFNG